jgi:hypothetical protein
MRITLALASAALLASAVTADAGWRRGPAEGADVVTAESRHGNGSISGPVRTSRWGYEVRLPHGTWVACRRSCSETLRVETIDIWENDGTLTGAGTLLNECGVFGCLDIHLPR